MTDNRIAEDNMNVQLKDITVTARDGRVSHLEQVYIRGSHVRFFIVPDMLRNAPMFRSRNLRGRGVGMARGRATVNRATRGGGIERRDGGGGMGGGMGDRGDRGGGDRGGRDGGGGGGMRGDRRG